MQADQQITDFVEQLKQVAGANLECVALFGSAASGEFHPDFSDINLLCVMRELTAADLARVAPAINAWTKKKFPAPLVFSHAELKHAADIFAIELIDIRDRHHILYGEDIFASLHVPMDMHRIQLEHNLRTKLLTLRQTYMQIVNDANGVRRLMLDSVSNFGTLFCHTLIAMGEKPQAGKADSVRRLAKKTQFDPGIFLQLLQVRARTAKEGDIDPVTGFAQYLAGIEKVVQAVDNL